MKLNMFKQTYRIVNLSFIYFQRDLPVFNFKRSQRKILRWEESHSTPLGSKNWLTKNSEGIAGLSFRKYT